jgi:hypothetical protein
MVLCKFYYLENSPTPMRVANLLIRSHRARQNLYADQFGSYPPPYTPHVGGVRPLSACREEGWGRSDRRRGRSPHMPHRWRGEAAGHGVVDGSEARTLPEMGRAVLATTSPEEVRKKPLGCECRCRCGRVLGFRGAREYDIDEVRDRWSRELRGRAKQWVVDRASSCTVKPWQWLLAHHVARLTPLPTTARFSPTNHGPYTSRSGPPKLLLPTPAAPPKRPSCPRFPFAPPPHRPTTKATAAGGTATGRAAPPRPERSRQDAHRSAARRSAGWGAVRSIRTQTTTP